MVFVGNGMYIVIRFDFGFDLNVEDLGYGSIGFIVIKLLIVC